MTASSRPDRWRRLASSNRSRKFEGGVRLTDQLQLADRGYPSVAYFEAVAAHGGTFIVRLTRSYDPWIRAAWMEVRRTSVPTRIRLPRLLAQHAGQRLDLDVDFHVRSRVAGFRVVVLLGRDDAALHEPPTHAVLTRPSRPPLSLPMAD